MHRERWISLCLTVVVLGWLACFEKYVVEGIFAARTFASARPLLALAIVVLAAIIASLLALITLIAEWRFERLVARGDEQSAAGTPAEALGTLIQAQRINDRFIGSRELRLCVLRRLSAVYQQLGYRDSCIDVEHRIRAIESLPPCTTLVTRIINESPEYPGPEPVRKTNYAIAAIFALCLLLAGFFLLPGPANVPLLEDCFFRCAGAALITFVMAEAMSGKAHGGARPTTAYWNRTPYWFSIRVGVFLCVGIELTLRLDRLLGTTGYFQLPASGKDWAILLGVLVLCSLASWILGYLHEKNRPQ
jgi:hypothetical protein